VLAVLLVLSTGTLSLAEQQVGLPQYVGIPTRLMNHYYAQQRRSQWCWAACIQMVLKRYGVEVRQEEIVRRSYGTDPHGNLPDWPGSVQLVTANLNNWGIDRAGKQYVVTASLGLGPPAPAVLIRELTAGHPVILGCQAQPQGHAVLCTAASYVLTQANPYNPTTPAPVIQTLVIRDPMPQGFWSSFLNPSARGRVEYRGDQLNRIIGAHWSIRVLVQGQIQKRVDTSGSRQPVGVKPEVTGVRAPGETKLSKAELDRLARGVGLPGRTPSKAPISGAPKAIAVEGDVKLTQSDIRWLEGREHPYTRFRLRYTNTGQQRKSCEVTVQVELASRKTGQLTRVFRSRKFTFDLRPGRSRAVKGTLEAYQDLEVHPRINCKLTTTPSGQ